MYILTIIPIAKGISKDTLTYFTKNNVSVGSIVSIPLRKKTAYGLVVSSRPGTEIKSELKTLTYNIRKIENIESYTFLSHSFIESAQVISNYCAGQVGSVLSALIPTAILENSATLTYTQKETPQGIFHETVLLQSDEEERYATYKSLIREEFARGRSIFFCMPTSEDVKNAKKTLEKGIETYTYSLHGGLSKKEVVSMWKKIIHETHPVLIIATGFFLSLPRDDIGTIILEKESSRAYKMQTRPFIDIRTAVEIIAKKSNRRLVLGDILLRTETLWEEKNGRYAELSPLKYRSLSTTQCEIVDMRNKKNGEIVVEKRDFSVMSPELIATVSKARDGNEHTFLFCGRKGMSPTTVCRDCGTVVVCNNCKAPVVLYNKKNNGKNLFVCHHCGERRNSEELCIHCKGWRLEALGIGIEKVEEEVKKIFPDSHVFVLDKEHVTTHKQAVKVRDDFYNTPNSIMIGTEMALTYLNQKIENIGVVSIDAFFSIPDFRINEKIFHIVLALRSLSERKMILQTRQEHDSIGYKICDYALRGNLVDFYRDEITERKEIGYPPFVTYIKITLSGEKIKIKKEMESIIEFLKPYTLTVFEAFNPGSIRESTIHGLISLPHGTWVDEVLLAKLRSLPPYFMIKVDPDTLL